MRSPTPYELAKVELRQRRIIDDKKPRLIANQAICLLQQGASSGALSQTPAATK
jgi:hypothetical protein